mmetsp:Transcript_38410/g.91104  ORF Transcript_38410/g.91104 Transcript_38410/m.91104 type:complete len:253 (-) Transcript_38410:2814-3572(-)
MHEEVHVLPAGEREQSPEAAHHACMQDDLCAPWLHNGPRHRSDSIPNMELNDIVELVRSAVEESGDAHELPTRGVVLHLGGNIGWETRHVHVAKLVGSGHRIVVQVERSRDIPWEDIVCIDVHLVLCRLVPHKLERLLAVPDVYPVAEAVDCHDHRGEVPVLALAEELLLADVVQAERVVHTHEESPLEGSHRPRDAVHGRLVEQRQLPSRVHPVEPDKPALHLPGVELQALRSPDGKEGAEVLPRRKLNQT